MVLLHGLGRTRLSMAGMARFLAQEGFTTWARTYPSRRRSIADLAELVAGWIEAEFGDQPVHVVTHSLGGILARHMAHRVPMARVVMLAPPNGGSALAAYLRGFSPFDVLYGPAGQEVGGAVVAGQPHPLPSAPTAVIAGTRATSLTNPISWVSGGLNVFGAERPHDGTVAVDETHLDGMVAFAEVDASHTWIMNHAEARAMTLQFLRHGRFAASDASTASMPPSGVIDS